MKINLTIGATAAAPYIQIEFLKDDETTSLGSSYIFAATIRRIRADGVSWWIDHISEDAHNRQIFFDDIVNLNGGAIGATTYAAVTALLVALSALVGGTIVLSGGTETPTMTVYAAGTTIAAGAKSVTVITDGTYAGNILGVAATADGIYTFAASPGNTLAAIAITRTAGNFTVIKIV